MPSEDRETILVADRADREARLEICAQCGRNVGHLAEGAGAVAVEPSGDLAGAKCPLSCGLDHLLDFLEGQIADLRRCCRDHLVG